MVFDMRATIQKLKEDLLAMDKQLRNTTHGSPKRAGSNVSSVVENRPPWNHGGGPLPQGSYHTSVRTRSKTRNLLPTALPRQQPPKQVCDTTKNLVHKQTINGIDKTVITVSVKNLQQGKRPFKPHTVLAESDNALVYQFANVGIPNTHASSPNRGVHSSASSNPAWRNILGKEVPQLTVPDGTTIKRCSESSPKLCPKRIPPCQDVAIEEEEPSRGQGGGDAGLNTPDDFLKLVQLVGELRGHSREPAVQRLVADIEDALLSFQSKENLDPQAASFLSRKRSRRSPKKDDFGRSREEDDDFGRSREEDDDFGGLSKGDNDFGAFSPRNVNLMRLSPSPDRLLLENKDTSSETANFTGHIQQFLSVFNACAQLSSSSERNHSSKRPRKKEVTATKESMERLCQSVEQAYKRVEEQNRTLKSNCAQLEEQLLESSQQLESVARSLEQQNTEILKQRSITERAESELRLLKEEQSKKSRADFDVDKLLSLENQVTKLADENRALTIDLGMLKMEKNRLEVMLTNKESELAEFKREIFVTDRPRKRVVTNVSSKEEVPMGVNSRTRHPVLKSKLAEHSLEKPDPEERLKPKEEHSGPIPGERLKSKEEHSPPIPEERLKSKEEHSPPIPEERLKSKEEHSTPIPEERLKSKEEHSPPIPEKRLKSKEEHLNRSVEGKSDSDEAGGVLFVDAHRTKSCRYFLPVNRAWQRVTAKKLGLTVVKLLKVEHTARPLTRPARTKSSRGDGNCFFRCISMYLVGTEDEHKFVRQSVVRYMRDHRSEFASEISDKYLNAMERDGEWATDNEIRAAARWLGVTIFTYIKYNRDGWQWQYFVPAASLDDTLTDEGAPGLYLQNTDSVHYDVVYKVVDACGGSVLPF